MSLLLKVGGGEGDHPGAGRAARLQQAVQLAAQLPRPALQDTQAVRVQLHPGQGEGSTPVTPL